MSARYNLLFKKYTKKLHAFYDKTKKDNAGNPISQENQTKHLFEKLWDLDPTQKKTRAETIIQWYCTDQIKEEDLYKISENLEFFESHKHLFSKKDLMKFKTYNDFFEMIYPILEMVRENEENSLSENQKDKKYREQMLQETTILEETEKYILLIPKTEEASCYWGRGTQWCTAATTSSNYFEDYNKNGSLYILLEKKTPQNQNPTKYQFHLFTTQFMNVKDRRITPEERESIESLYENTPDNLLKQYCHYFVLEDSQNFPFTNTNPKAIYSILKDFPTAYKHLPVEEITQDHIIRSLKTPPHFITDAQKILHLVNDEIESLILQHHPEKYVNYLKDNKKSKDYILENPELISDVSPERLTSLLDDEIESILLNYAPRKYLDYFKNNRKKIEHYILENPGDMSMVPPEYYTLENLNFILFSGHSNVIEYSINSYYELPGKNYQSNILEFFATYFPEPFYNCFKHTDHKNPQYKTIKKILEKIDQENPREKSFYNSYFKRALSPDDVRESDLTDIFRYYRPEVYLKKTLKIKTILENLEKGKSFPNDTPTRTFEDDIIRLLRKYHNNINILYPLEDIYNSAKSEKNGITIYKNLLIRVLERLPETPLIENQPVLENLYSLILQLKTMTEHSTEKEDFFTITKKFIEITEKYLQEGISLNLKDFEIHFRNDIENSNSSDHKQLYQSCCSLFHQNNIQKEADLSSPLLSQDISFSHFEKLLDLYSKQDTYSEDLQKRFMELLQGPHVKNIIEKYYEKIKKNPDAFHFLSPILLEFAEKNQTSFHKTTEEISTEHISKNLKMFYKENLDLYKSDLNNLIINKLFQTQKHFSESYIKCLESFLEEIPQDQRKTIEKHIVENIYKKSNSPSDSEKIISFLKNKKTLPLSFQISLLTLYTSLKYKEMSSDTKENQKSVDDFLENIENSSKLSVNENKGIFFYLIDSLFDTHQKNFSIDFERKKTLLKKILPNTPDDLYSLLCDYFKKDPWTIKKPIPKNKIIQHLIDPLNLKEKLTKEQQNNLEKIAQFSLFSGTQNTPKNTKQNPVRHTAFENNSEKSFNFEYHEMVTKFLKENSYDLWEENSQNTIKLKKDLPGIPNNNNTTKEESTLNIFIDTLTTKDNPAFFHEKIWKTYGHLPEDQKRDILKKAYEKKMENPSHLTIWRVRQSHIPIYFPEIREYFKKEVYFYDHPLTSLLLFSSDHQKKFKTNPQCQDKVFKEEGHNTPTWILPINETSLDKNFLKHYKENPKLEILDLSKSCSLEHALTLYKREIERTLKLSYKTDLSEYKDYTISKIGEIPVTQKTKNDLFDLRKILTEVLSQKDSKDFTYKALKFLKDNPMSVEIKTVFTQSRNGTLYKIPEYIFRKTHSEKKGTLLREYPYDDKIFENILRTYQNTPNIVLLTDKLDPVSKVLFKNIPEQNPSSKKSKEHSL